MWVDQVNNGKAIKSFFLQDLDGGGAERAIIRLAGEIALQGHSVDLVVGYAATDYRAEVSARVNLVDFSSRSSMVVFFKLVAYLRDSQPLVIMSALDTANIMMIFAAILARFRGRKVISQRAALNASLRDLGVARTWVTRALWAMCFPRADAVISNSRYAAKDLSRKLGIASEKIFTIPNAVDTTLIARLATAPLDVGVLPNGAAPLILSIGSLTKRKDMATLIRAFQLVVLQRVAKLVIVGKGPEQSALESLIKELGLVDYVHLAGFDANPYKWVAAASVLVSSSTDEGFPNVIAESLALGCAVVATDCPGDSAELLAHGRWGRLVPIGDAKRMAEEILRTLDDPCPPQGHIRAAEFSPSRNAAAYLDVLLPQGHLAITARSRGI
jgi:glycosyltransferase involved in cell wall biosynthesis